MSKNKKLRDHKAVLGESSHVLETEIVDALKHFDTFYDKPPPGLVKEELEERPEDTIPDTPENQSAREFLAKAPTKGLWMPLGKEVKVMQCWRCKNYGHRTGDKECPLFLQGNAAIEKFRYVHEDPMYSYVNETVAKEKQERVDRLKALLNESSPSSDSSDSESDSSSSDSSRRKSSKRKHSKSRY